MVIGLPGIYKMPAILNPNQFENLQVEVNEEEEELYKLGSFLDRITALRLRERFDSLDDTLENYINIM
jgi:hypothetical protein